MIEVLVCLVVSAIVIGGGINFYINAMKENLYINQTEIAKQYISELEEIDSIASVYDGTHTLSLKSSGVSEKAVCTEYCSFDDYYMSYIVQWQKRMKASLADAEFQIELKDVKDGKVSIAWRNAAFEGEGKKSCIFDSLPDEFVCFTANIR